jgi:mycoredoxin
MSEPLTVCGATYCDDTQRTRAYLKQHNIPFKEINIDHNAQAEQFVIFVNKGYRSTPTLIIGDGKRKLVFTEPSNVELAQILVEAGYLNTAS